MSSLARCPWLHTPAVCSQGHTWMPHFLHHAAVLIVVTLMYLLLLLLSICLTQTLITPLTPCHQCSSPYSTIPHQTSAATSS